LKADESVDSNGLTVFLILNAWLVIMQAQAAIGHPRVFEFSLWKLLAMLLLICNTYGMWMFDMSSGWQSF